MNEEMRRGLELLYKESGIEGLMDLYITACTKKDFDLAICVEDFLYGLKVFA